jgi:hypothetical protein
VKFLNPGRRGGCDAPGMDERKTEGPSYGEYALVLGLIAALAVVVFLIFGGTTEEVLSTISHSV